MQAAAPAVAPIRVLVVDSDRRVRESLRDLLACVVGPAAVTAVGTAEDARTAATTVEPNVIVIDPNLPDPSSGLDLLDELRMSHPKTRLLLMSWHDTNDDVAGHAADTTLDKADTPEHLIAAITRTAGRGVTA